jgi:ABC-2 type transport system ATP-binding protein
MSDGTTETTADLAIETHGLRKTFGAFEALKGVDLQVPRGSIFGLVGPNGAGKTTTFSILCGFLSPTSGTARVLGKAAHDRVGLFGRVGALPQDAPLPTRMTSHEALRYWGELGGLSVADARDEATRWLELVGLAKEGGKKGPQLSHGMAKRVSLAQAFLGEPELVLLDEPTSGLDPRTAHEIKQLIRDHRGARTVVVSSHDLSQIEELCDGVAIIDHGVVRQQGTLGEVTGRGELVRILLADDTAENPLAAVRTLAFATDARFDAATKTLEIRVKDAPPEVAVPALLKVVLASGGRVVGVTRGQRLEERMLQLT